MNSGAWWVTKHVAVVAVPSAAGAWAVIWVFDPSPNLLVVGVWAVSIGLITVWWDAAKMNERRVDEESRVLRAGHRNRRPQ